MQKVVSCDEDPRSSTAARSSSSVGAIWPTTASEAVKRACALVVQLFLVFSFESGQTARTWRTRTPAKRSRCRGRRSSPERPMASSSQPQMGGAGEGRPPLQYEVIRHCEVESHGEILSRFRLLIHRMSGNKASRYAGDRYFQPFASRLTHCVLNTGERMRFSIDFVS